METGTLTEVTETTLVQLGNKSANLNRSGGGYARMVGSSRNSSQAEAIPSPWISEAMVPQCILVISLNFTTQGEYHTGIQSSLILEITETVNPYGESFL